MRLGGKAGQWTFDCFLKAVALWQSVLVGAFADTI